MTTFSRLALAIAFSGAVLAPSAARAQASDVGGVYDASVILTWRKLSVANPIPAMIAGITIGAPEVSETQLDSIKAHNVAFQTAAAKEWAVLEQIVATAPASFQAADLVARIDATYDRVVDMLAKETAAARALLTAEQAKGMPRVVTEALDATIEK